MRNRYRAWLFKGGDYPDKGVNADPEMLAEVVSNTNASDTPFDIEHASTEGVLDFGGVVPGSLRVEYGRPPQGQPSDTGHWITADVEIEDGVDKLLKSRGLSVLLDTAKKVIEKVAVTTAPRVPGASFSATPEGIVYTGGSLMRVQFNDTAPTEGAQGEPELTDGFLTKLRKALGIGGSEESQVTPPVTEAAPLSVKGLPAADPNDAFFSDPRVVAMQAKLDAVTATAEQTAADARRDRIAAMSLQYKQAGVPPWMVDLAVPFAAGEPKVTVAFAQDGGKFETKELDAPAAFSHILETMRGAVPFDRRLPTDDIRETHVSFDERSAARAEELKREHPEWTKFHCQQMADAELAGKE